MKTTKLNRIPTSQQITMTGLLMIAPMDTIPFRNGKCNMLFADKDGQTIYIKCKRGYLMCWQDPYSQKTYVENITTKQFKERYE